MARSKRLTLKDHVRETLIFNQRVIIAAVIVVIMTAILLARLAYLQIVNVSHYSLLSENNRVSTLPIPPTRGLIYDRNGILLAQNLPSFTLELVPEHIKDLDQTLAELDKLIHLTEQDLARFKKFRKRHKRRFEGIPLRFRLNDQEVARISVNQYRLPGVEINAQLTRHYPLGSLASHAVGYVGRINESEARRLDESNYSGTNHIGKIGIEKSYEDLLHGTVGFQRVETNAQGRILRVLERTLPIPGKNLYLNLDVKLQAIAEQGFTIDKEQNTGAVVAIDPRDGAVLTLASLPTFDPNLFVNGIDTKTYTALRDSPDRPLFNRALRGQYPPGSTVKPLIGLTGLEFEEVTSHQEVDCPGWYTLKNDPRRYRDWKKEGHQATDLTKAIVESCDVYFYDLSLALGIDNIYTYLSQFGLGELTGIDIEGEKPGLMPSPAWKRRTRQLPWFPGETLITGIGQGFMLTTPLQLSSITGIISLRGQRMQPRMLYAIESPETTEFTTIPAAPVPQQPQAEEQNWQTIIHAMQEVVHGVHGTARRIGQNLPFKIAGKTGTAQVFGIKQDEEYVEEEIKKKLRDHALFIAFAPVKDPQIAIAVIVENGGSGGATAAPIARKVMDQYLLNTEN